jgi:hypothetical protein
MRKIILLIALLFGLYACKDSESIDFGYDYFPLEEGRFVEYKVREVFHDVNVNPQHDTTKYRLKTIIGEEVLDNTGRPVRKFFQFKYDLQTGGVLDQRVWTTVLDGGRGEVVEENQRLIKLIFAVKDGEEWNVNAFNDSPEKTVFYSKVNEPLTINSFSFEETVKVNYDDFFSLVDYRKKYEVYAKGIGLVERSFKDFTIQNFDTTDIRKGTEVYYQLLNYGLE